MLNDLEEKRKHQGSTAKFCTNRVNVLSRLNKNECMKMNHITNPKNK